MIKKLIIILLIIAIASTVAFTYLKIFVQPPFGSLGILLISLLGFFTIFLFVTLYHYNTGRKDRVGKIWMSFIAIFLTYFIAEAVLSLLFVQRLSPKIISDQYRHHKLVPNTSSKFETKEYSYFQRVNNIGLRGPDIQLSPRTDNYRILMLGDSFTMGKGVADDKTFSAILEKSLNNNKIMTNHKNVEVVNGGVDSYSPILSFLQLTRDLKNLQPDLVVLNFDMSDLVQEVAYRRNATYDEKGKMVGIDGRRRLTLRIKDWINRNLYISRFIIFHLNKRSKQTEISIENVIAQADKEILKHTMAGDTQDRRDQWNSVFDSILRIKKYCDQHGVKFLLTIYPWGHQVSNTEWVTGRSVFLPDHFEISDKSVEVILDFSRKNNIEILNLFPAFRSFNGNAQLYFNHDIHWTETGHKLVAKEFEQWIRTDLSGDCAND